MPAEGTKAGSEVVASAWRSREVWLDYAETIEENTADFRRAKFSRRRLARQQVVCLATGVSPREEDAEYEEASGKTAGALSTDAVCRTCCAQGKTWPS